MIKLLKSKMDESEENNKNNAISQENYNAELLKLKEINEKLLKGSLEEFLKTKNMVNISKKHLLRMKASRNY